FFEWDHSTYNSYFHRIKDATELTIPKLDEMAFEQVEVACVPFLKFVANKGIHDEAANNSFVLRGYVRHWLTNVWSEYDRIKLTDIVGSTKLGREQKGEKLVPLNNEFGQGFAATGPALYPARPAYIDPSKSPSNYAERTNVCLAPAA